MKRLIVVMTMFGVGVAMAAPGLQARQVVLDNDTLWSYYIVARHSQRKDIGQPPAEWAPPIFGHPDPRWHAPDFDDSEWGLASAPFPEAINRWGSGSRASGAGSILLRRSFRVQNPAAAGLRLSLAYRGGVVVYLNGREIARGHIPAGDNVFDLAAEEYPREAYFTASGGPVSSPGEEIEDENLREHLTNHRLRRIDELAFPAESLRTGVNVLAIQINEAPQPDQHRFFEAQGWPRVRDQWSRCGLVEIRLTAAGGVIAGRAELPAVLVRALNPLQDINEQTATAAAHQPPAPLRLVGPRGGIASAPVVVLAAQPIAAPQVQITALSDGNGNRIEPGAVRLLYGSQHHRDRFGATDGFSRDTHHVLSATPSEPARLHSVWVQARIAGDAPPGRYAGRLVVAAGGASGAVPVELVVGRYRLPGTGRFASHVGMLHNPDNTARRYGVERWSDAHFALLGQVFDHLASIGNDVLYVPLAMNNHLGSGQTLVRWVKRGERYEVDLSVLRRYLRLYHERCGPPSVLGLYVWDVIMGERGNEQGSVSVTVVDGHSGAVSEQPAPWYGAPGSDAFWRPAIDGVLRAAQELGWERDTVMWAVGHDAKPGARTTEFLDSIAPGLRWTVCSHARGYTPRDGRLRAGDIEVGYHELPWGPDIRPHDRGIIGGWDGKFLQSTIARFHFHSLSGTRRMPATYRTLVSSSIGTGRERAFRGVSRFQLDYWPVPRDDDRRAEASFTRLLRMGGWVNLMRNHEFLLAPGPAGPEPTVAFLQLREGVQEAEARIAIEQTLADPQRRARVHEQQLERAWAVIREHAALLSAGSAVWQGYVSLPWREHAARLFDVAGELQEAQP
jgi:hypothetical protein